MTKETWNITLRISRRKGAESAHWQDFKMDVDPDEYVLDAVERVWAFHDRSLTFRHACHHSTCGACGMIVNGVEKLTCITPIRSVTHNGTILKIEPLHNFPVISDLVVDMSPFFMKMEETGASHVLPVEKAGLGYETQTGPEGQFERLVDCLECGLCISVCPAAHTSTSYLGPAPLAAIQQTLEQSPNVALLSLADSEAGVWRCHSAYECSAVCPSNVDPAWRIMNLRRRVIGNRIRQFFGK